VLRTVRFLAVAVIATATVFPLKAASVIQPTFDELVTEARQIILAETVSSRSALVSNAYGRFIETTVTFKVDSVIKGAFIRERSLTFLGGQVGDMVMEVSDMVQFKVGDRDVLFVNDADKPISPIVGFNHGRFRVTRDNFVLTHDGQPLGIEASRSSRGPARLFAAPMSQGVTLNGFIAHIRTTAIAAGVSLR